jgi:hypothetical protein
MKLMNNVQNTQNVTDYIENISILVCFIFLLGTLL